MAYRYEKAEDLVGTKVVDDGKGNYLGECVSLVKRYTSAPQTTKWKEGKHVRGNTIEKGTAIATFHDKKYKGHAAFYISQGSDHIKVVEQYAGLTKVQSRKITFKGKKDKGDGGVNDGDAYSVIE